MNIYKATRQSFTHRVQILTYDSMLLHVPIHDLCMQTTNAGRLQNLR